jgi:transcriptional regulator with XRE-family HTH domain
MTNPIGRSIHSLRKQHDLTQQQLSELLGVSVAAVSKWETGSAYPDIALLPRIASLFDVSIDYLFNLHLDAHDNRAMVLEKANRLIEARDYASAVDLLKEALFRYPNDMPLRFKRAEAMIYLGVVSQPESERLRLLTEANAALKEVISSAKSREMIDEGYYLLGMSYINLKEFEKAEEAIHQLNPSIHMKAELALMRLFLEKGDANLAKRQFQLNVFFSLVQIHANTLWLDKLYADEPEKAIAFYEGAIEALKAFSNNQPCRFDAHISQFYERAALEYAKVGNPDRAINALRLAVKYARSYDDLQTDDDLPQFDRLTGDDTAWDKVCNRGLQLWKEIEAKKNHEYKILCDRPEFMDLISDLKNSAL